jgi:phosphate acetyltransferase
VCEPAPGGLWGIIGRARESDKAARPTTDMGTSWRRGPFRANMATPGGGRTRLNRAVRAPFHSEGTIPLQNVINSIRERAAKYQMRIALPEVECDRTLHAAARACQAKIAQVVLIGSPKYVSTRAKALDIDLSCCEVVDPEDPAVHAECAAAYYEARKDKGLTEQEADEAVNDGLYCAAALLRMGKVDGSVAGRIHSTPDVLRPLLRIVGTKPGLKTVSSCFIMTTPQRHMGVDGMFIFADAGVLPQPTAEQLADIAITSAESCRLYFEVEPRVAMLSFSTKGSATHPDVDKVVEATKLAQARRPDLLIEGELQGDAALVPEVAASKAPGDRLQGRANTLIFPDLDAGNICYKLVQRLTGGEAYGPLVQGLAKPGLDLSRGSESDEIVNVIAIAALRAGAGI